MADPCCCGHGNQLRRIEQKLDKVLIETIPALTTEIAVLKHKATMIGILASLVTSAAVQFLYSRINGGH